MVSEKSKNKQTAVRNFCCHSLSRSINFNMNVVKYVCHFFASPKKYSRIAALSGSATKKEPRKDYIPFSGWFHD